MFLITFNIVYYCSSFTVFRKEIIFIKGIFAEKLRKEIVSELLIQAEILP